MTDILIIRGWGSRRENWQKFISILEERDYRIFSPDLPGFGSTPSPCDPWAIDDYVDWVKDFCENNNLSQFFLLGHSFGGGVAIKYILKYPESVKKLILADVSIIRKKTKSKEGLKKTASFLKKLSFLPFYNQFRKLSYKLIFRKSDYPFVQGVMKDTYLKIINEDLSGLLEKVKIPTLIVWGEKDESTPIQDAFLIKEKITGSELKTLPKICHNPHLEAPEKLAEIILKFLNK